MSIVRRDPYLGRILTNTPLTSASCHRIRIVAGPTSALRAEWGGPAETVQAAA
jgi:hypothetical protein